MSICNRFQMNVLLAPVNGITMLAEVPTVYFPVMWFENKAGVPENLVSQLSLLAKLPTILQGMGWAEVNKLIYAFGFHLLCFRSDSPHPCLSLQDYVSWAGQSHLNCLMCLKIQGVTKNYLNTTVLACFTVTVRSAFWRNVTELQILRIS